MLTTGYRNTVGGKMENYLDILERELNKRGYKRNTENEALYRVQVGAYRNKDNADRMLNSLLMDGFPAFIIYEDGYYKVQVGAYRILLNAIKMEQRLRRFRYSTYIVYS